MHAKIKGTSMLRNMLRLHNDAFTSTYNYETLMHNYKYRIIRIVHVTIDRRRKGIDMMLVRVTS